MVLLIAATAYSQALSDRLDSAHNEADRLVFEMPRHEIGIPAAKEVSARGVRKAFRREASEPLQNFVKEKNVQVLGVGNIDFSPPSRCPEILTAHLKTFPLLKGVALTIAHELAIEYKDGTTEPLNMVGGTFVYHLPDIASQGRTGILGRITGGVEATALVNSDWRFSAPVSAHAGVRLGSRFNTKLEAVATHDSEELYGIRLSANWN